MKRQYPFDVLTRPTPSNDATVILCLNDDCLLEVFKWLNLIDLCAVADTCSRFRENAKICFEFSKKNNLILPDDIVGDSFSVNENEAILNTARVLRNFGKNIIEYKEKTTTNNRIRSNNNSASTAWRLVFRRKIIKLLNQYCRGNLIELQFMIFIFDDEAVLMMRPLLGSIKKLSFMLCGINETLLHNLPSWCPELQEFLLHKVFSNRIRPGMPVGFEYERFLRTALFQPFHKLEKIVFVRCDMLADDIKEVLKCNPQLKGIIVNENCVDDDIFQIIAEHASQIEFLSVGLLDRRDSRNSNLLYLRQLKRLQTFKLMISPSIGWSTYYMAWSLNNISGANIPLKKLQLAYADFSLYARNEIITEIKKFKQLQVLDLLKVKGLTEPLIADACKNLPELSKLDVKMDFTPTRECILEIIGNANKLASLKIVIIEPEDSKICIDVKTYMEMVNILEKRHEKTQLKVELDTHAYRLNVPFDLVRAHKDRLSISFIIIRR